MEALATVNKPLALAPVSLGSTTPELHSDHGIPQSTHSEVGSQMGGASSEGDTTSIPRSVLPGGLTQTLQGLAQAIDKTLGVGHAPSPESAPRVVLAQRGASAGRNDASSLSSQVGTPNRGGMQGLEEKKLLGRGRSNYSSSPTRGIATPLVAATLPGTVETLYNAASRERQECKEQRAPRVQSSGGVAPPQCAAAPQKRSPTPGTPASVVRQFSAPINWRAAHEQGQSGSVSVKVANPSGVPLASGQRSPMMTYRADVKAAANLTFSPRGYLHR